MQNAQNPYWDEIKDRLDEVVDGMSIGFRRPSRYQTLEQRMQMIEKEIRDLSVERSLVMERLWIPPEPIDFDEKTYLESAYHHRKDFCQKYTWAIPDPDTIAFLVEQSSPFLMEIGAGTGYWCWQLAQHGLDVLAYDIAPPNLSWENEYHSPRDENSTFTREMREVYHPIEIGGPAQCADHPDRTLFLCWPPMSEMAAQSLDYYQGDRLIYIGEGSGGCTADDAFFEQIEGLWEEKASHTLVQWDGIHDVVTVYERKRRHPQ